MLTLTASKIKPISHNCPSFYDLFGLLALNSDFIRIAAGYVSISSLLLLQRNVTKGSLPPTDLIIGMHAFDGFTKAQYQAAVSLAETLTESKTGDVYVCTAFPYHGKTYTFWNMDKPRAALIGSSNLSGLDSNSGRVFETDVVIKDAKTLSDLSALQCEIQNKATRRILDWKPGPFKEHKDLMTGVPDVEKISPKEVNDIYSNRTGVYFDLPLKNENKSNLNCYFGKGRLNSKTGLIRPRPWYEVEVIVSKTITQRSGYPVYEEFDVVTDDGWKFHCETNGDYSKNFRSSGGLTVLGSWVKGRLEAQSIIKVGDRITEEHLSRYGRDHLTLSATNDPNLWFLSFSPDK